MPITASEIEHFGLLMDNSNLINSLPKAVTFFKENVDPEDVYDFKTLQSWAKNYDIETIFGEDALIGWAEKNGYIKEKSED